MTTPAAIESAATIAFDATVSFRRLRRGSGDPDGCVDEPGFALAQTALARQKPPGAQHLVELRIDCDEDCLLLLVDQTGVACHTGRRACLRAWRNDACGTRHSLLPAADLYGRSSHAKPVAALPSSWSARRPAAEPAC
jgi:hypothetical protein